MKAFYSLGSILCFLLTIVADGRCDEDPGTSTMSITTLESAEPSTLPESDVSSALPESDTSSALPESDMSSALPESDTSSDLPESDAASTLPQSDAASTFPESDAASTLPESDASSTLPESDESSTLPESDAISTLPESVVNSVPVWWLGPEEFDNTSADERDSKNETLNNENGTSTDEWTLPPLIVIRYPLEGPPEILVGSLSQENGTYKFESENGNSSGENEFDVNDFNMTGYPFFPVERIDEEIMFDTLNGTEVWIEDVFVIPEENVTEGVENKTEEVETTASTVKGNEQMEETVLPTANVSGDTEVGALTEPQESTTLSSPIVEDTENALPV